MVLVFAGTLAQIDHDIWYVIKNYFRCGIALIEFQVFFPRDWNIPGVFPFPGGWTLGAALGVNLLAAHALRFKVTGSGTSLWSGWGLIAAGALLTYLVVQSGLDDSIESELSPAFCNGLWHALRAALAGGTLVFAYFQALSYQSQKQADSFWLWILGAISCGLLTLLVAWLFLNPEVRLDPSGLRILWQLIKATAAGIVLLAGCYFVFGRRAGIVLLHGGIALLMFSELFTGLKAVEAQMWLTEGQTGYFAEDSRKVELAVVDKSSDKADVVTLVPQHVISRAATTEELIDHPDLPVKLQVIRFLPNSQLRLRQPGESNPATRGQGLLYTVDGEPATTGVDLEQRIESPAAFVELFDKETDESLGSIMLWAQFSPSYIVEPIEIAGKHHEFSLRYRRVQKDYAIKLIDFRHDTFVGSTQAKNFSSEVQLTDPQRQVDRRLKTWMNNPIRYRGDTIYQASYDPGNSRRSALQVVTNTGWMVPYVSCMLILTGMLAHFGIVFVRFAQRKKTVSSQLETSTLGGLAANWTSAQVLVPALVVLVFGGWSLSKMRPKPTPANQMQLREFGELPVAYQGRVQPLDTLARNALTVLSGKEALVVPGEKSALAELFGFEKTEPAIRWLLDLASNAPAFRDHHCLRIDNLDVLQTLGLERRKGFRYSLAELFENEGEYLKQVQLAADVPENERTLTQARFIKLANDVSLLTVLHDSFSSPLRFIGMNSREELQADLMRLTERIGKLNRQAPLVVPPSTAGEKWRMLLDVESTQLFEVARGKSADTLDPAAEQFRTILASYADNKVSKFNKAVEDYREIVAERAAADAEFDEQSAHSAGPGARKTAEKLNVDRLEFESFFNYLRPFVLAMAMYIVAFLLASFAWLGATNTLNRAANWLLWWTVIVHTLALLGRIYISGRPPVTNLYSSAVFIGWAAVLFALVFERIYRLGIGNLLAAVIGFPTLFIAHNLAGDGDTFMVLQAVLDTQFWLATHVVCITLGYSATFVAGVLGLFYVLVASTNSERAESLRQVLPRAAYGTICFATLFSFIGTILGGLWADDSWGRFWGWDPKENGALLIVIWNALVLHARWGGMIQRRGLCILSIFGNVVTAWSWFGVNAMGVGLHSYGFRAGMAFWLSVFVLTQLFIMLLGMISKDGGQQGPLPSGS